MSLKILFGLEETDITDEEIITKIKQAQEKNLDYVEFEVGEEVIKVNLPHISLNPDADDLGS